MKASHPLWQTARALRGNQRACVVTEPLWSLPYYFFAPYASVYMAAIGLGDAQIGALASVGLAVQLVWAVFSGAIVDKLGRRRTILVFGLLSWTIPCVLWGMAQGYAHFMIAVVFNSMWRVSGNCFSCLIVENGDSEKLVHVYTILSLIGLVAGFLLPLLGLCIDRFSLVPTMRVVYLASAAVMGAKYVLHYRLLRESAIGLRRMNACRGRSLFSLAFGGKDALITAFREARLWPYVALMALMNCFNTVQATFWPLFVTGAYGVSASTFSLFPLVKAAITMVVYLLITPRIRLHAARNPLLSGLGAQAAGLAALLLCQGFGAAALAAVFFSALCEAFALAILSPLLESMLSVAIPARERARVNSLIAALVLLISMPVGWISGLLSQSDRMLPFVLNLCILAAEVPVALRAARISKQAGRAQSA
ncbi:MAG: Major Facilitator Superfamily protein [Firmicutes bacterium ADurb.Bin248]|nr:MAG: Major Facilitator Superfamily protein [Firmicutes bacterium ADurb.Bin248]HOF99794.1 MFS transporter [Clostridia bacterium]HPK14354.1 MFS transporter [Clostridia bacterium]